MKELNNEDKEYEEMDRKYNNEINYNHIEVALIILSTILGICGVINGVLIFITFFS